MKIKEIVISIFETIFVILAAIFMLALDIINETILERRHRK